MSAFNGSKTINVQGLPRGIVFVEWTDGEQRIVKKVLLK